MFDLDDEPISTDCTTSTAPVKTKNKSASKLWTKPKLELFCGSLNLCEATQSVPIQNELLFRSQVPKMIRNDIRKRYADMFTNVTNSYDVCLLGRFLRDFSLSELTFVQNSENPPMPDIPNYFEFVGSAVFLQFWHNRTYLSPDMCMRLTDTRIVSHSQTRESRVECNFEVKGTRLFHLPFDIIIPSSDEQTKLIENSNKKRELKPNKKRKTDPSFDGYGLCNNEIVYQHHLLPDISDILNNLEGTHLFEDSRIQRAIRAAPRLAEPEQVCVKGIITMFLDSNKVIKALQFEAIK
jgi:hypothetical protein